MSQSHVLSFTLLLHGFDEEGKRVGVWETPVIALWKNGHIKFQDCEAEPYRFAHTSPSFESAIRQRGRLCCALVKRPVDWELETPDLTITGFIRDIYHGFEHVQFGHGGKYVHTIVSIAVMGMPYAVVHPPYF